MKECAFCSNPLNKERMVAQNELAWSFPTNIPITPGHLLICPKRCVAKVDDFTLEELAAIFDLHKKLKNALRLTFEAEGFNSAWNEGAAAGQSVQHFHLHLVPRKKNDTGITSYEPRSFLYRPGSRAETPQAELLEVKDLIVKSFK